MIIDEAHNFRNHGGRDDDEEENPWGSRWWRMQEICKGKTVFLLTATPDQQLAVRPRPPGRAVHRRRRRRLLRQHRRQQPAQVHGRVWRSRSRATAVPDMRRFDDPDGQGQAVLSRSSTRTAASTPSRAPRSLAAASGRLPGDAGTPGRAVRLWRAATPAICFTELQNAFSRATPLFVLPMYYPLAFSNEQGHRHRWPRTGRGRSSRSSARSSSSASRSSLAAFAGSCLDLSAKMLRWLDVNTKVDPDQESATRRLARPPTSRLCRRSTTATAPTLEEVWHEERPHRGGAQRARVQPRRRRVQARTR